MNKSGCLRRVVILLIFGWGFNRFVLEGELLPMRPDQQEFIRQFMWVAIVFGIICLFAQRVGPGSGS